MRTIVCGPFFVYCDNDTAKTLNDYELLKSEFMPRTDPYSPEEADKLAARLLTMDVIVTGKVPGGIHYPDEGTLKYRGEIFRYDSYEKYWSITLYFIERTERDYEETYFDYVRSQN